MEHPWTEHTLPLLCFVGFPHAFDHRTHLFEFRVHERAAIFVLRRARFEPNDASLTVDLMPLQ
jgi:hypothetical protein